MPVNNKCDSFECGNVSPRSATVFVTMEDRADKVERGIWESFGKRVRAYRDSHGWSQEACGARIGMTRQQWNRIENGAGTKRPTVIRMAESLGLPAEVLFEWAGWGNQLTERASHVQFLAQGREEQASDSADGSGCIYGVFGGGRSTGSKPLDHSASVHSGVDSEGAGA